MNTYLLDTGANISTLKESFLPKGTLMDMNDKCKINGIVDGLVETLGSVDACLLIDNVEFQHHFQIVSEDFPVPADGILGLDFITKYNCSLDYGSEDWKMTLQPDFLSYVISIPVSNSLYKSSLILPPRCEVIRKVHFNSTENEVLIHDQEIAEGIFVGRTIVSTDRPFVRILNTTDEYMTLRNVVLKCEKISNYNVFNMNSYQNTNRSEVIEILQKNFPEFAKDKLTKICKEFEDIFALETDTLSVNNFYKQKLRLKDETPVYIKNYRIPESHKRLIER